MSADLESGSEFRSRLDRVETALLLFGIIGILCLAWLPRLNDPFIRPHENNNARYGVAAKSHLNFGLPETLGGNHLYSLRDGVAYVNHPGTLSLIIAGSYALLGVSEAGTRLVPMLFSVLFLFTLYHIVRSRTSTHTAGLAAFCAAAVPMFLWYGIMANFEPLILPLGLLALYFYDRNKPLSAAIFCGLATLIDHGGALIVIGAATIRFGRPLLPLLAAAVLGEFVNFTHIYLIAGAEGIKSILDSGISRSTVSTAPTEFLAREATRIYYFFSPLFLLLVPYGFLRGRKTNRRLLRLAGGLLVWGTSYVLIFNDAAFVHDYWLYFLIPGLAIPAAIGMKHFPRFIRIATLFLIVFLSLYITFIQYYVDVGWYRNDIEAIRFAKSAPEESVILSPYPGDYLIVNFYTDRVIKYSESVDTLTVVSELESDTK